MIEVRAAVMADIDAMAPLLRPGDLAECEAMGLAPDDALEASLMASNEAWVALEDGKPVAMWGYGVSGLLADAEVWLLTSPGVERHKKLFLQMNQQFIAEIMARFGGAVAYVHAEYGRAVKWLAWLGFQRAATVNINGAEFFEMRIRKH